MTLDEMAPIGPEKLKRAQGESSRDIVLDTVRRFLDVGKNPEELYKVIGTVTYSARPQAAAFRVQFAGASSPDPWFAEELPQRALGVRAWSNVPPYLFRGGETIPLGRNDVLGQPFLSPTWPDMTSAPSPSSVLTNTWMAEVQNLLDPDEDGLVVDEAVVRRAIAFLRICPNTGPGSDFSASGRDDGDVMLTWSGGYCPLLSILITADRRLVYSALLPRGHDTEQVQGELPWIPSDGVPPVVQTCFELFADAAA